MDSRDHLAKQGVVMGTRVITGALRVALVDVSLVLVAGLSVAQVVSPKAVLSSTGSEGDSRAFIAEPSSVDVLSATSLPADAAPGSRAGSTPHHGLLVRILKRGLEDQKELYTSPFKPTNLKWDALFLGATAALLATDRQVMRNVPTDHVDISHRIALTSLAGTGTALGSVWAYGIKTNNPHARETGALALESLANTFLIYTPMQFIAGRERPDEGTGNGRFWRHGNFNTSFPAGHPMFTWAMASVVAHEYPRPWVKVLAYGAALSVSGARLTGRNHFPSDIWVGSVLGYLIGTHIFHAHCDPNFSEACHR